MQSFDAWRAQLEAENKGRSWDSLVTTTDGGVRIAPLVLDAPTSTLGARRFPPATGAVLAAGTAAPAGPALAWWLGAPGARAASTRVAVVEAAEHVARPTDSSFERVMIGAAPVPGARLASPDALAAAESGAGPIAELAAALVPFVTALEGGADPRSLAVALSVSPEFFVEVAKLRAARRAIEGLVRAAGQVGDVLLLVREKARSRMALDPETNAIRSTIAAAAGLVGGAAAVATQPHAEGDVAARLAWTQGEVLTRQARVHLFDDAAAGAPFVEALTEQIGAAAWELARAALRGEPALSERIAADAKARERAVRTRTRPLVGVSRFAAGGAVQPSTGDGAPFESLRAHAPGLRAAVVWLGDAKLAARAEFAREALELLGAPVTVGRPASTIDEAASVDADLVVIAAADGDFAGPVVQLTERLSQRGVKVAIAGKPREAEAALKAAGARAFLFVGGDIALALSLLIGGSR